MRVRSVVLGVALFAVLLMVSFLVMLSTVLGSAGGTTGIATEILVLAVPMAPFVIYWALRSMTQQLMAPTDRTVSRPRNHAE